jgi:1-acyl-sn-glycerol-3-phosphate acyltransferase
MSGMAEPHDFPHVPIWFQNGFHGFLRPFLRRHFHAIAVARENRCDRELVDTVPLIVYGNHASWWDPLIAHFLNRQLFPGRQFYAPIDADALQQYRVFGKLGFYGVRMNTTSGAAAFLKRSNTILAAGSTAIWMTPEGRFADARDHSAPLMPGLAHLCTRMSEGVVVPLALEYVFWDERLPVCLTRWGTPLLVSQHPSCSKADWSERLTVHLRQTQQRLAELAIARSSSAFDNLIRGQSGAGLVYDSFRRVKSWACRQPFRARHGEQFE